MGDHMGTQDCFGRRLIPALLTLGLPPTPLNSFSLLLPPSPSSLPPSLPPQTLVEHVLEIYGAWDLWDQEMNLDETEYARISNRLEGVDPRMAARGVAVGNTIRRFFEGHGWFQGEVTKYREPYFTVSYADGADSSLRTACCRPSPSPLVAVRRSCILPWTCAPAP